MKFLTKLIACLLIAWLPILGYSAQASLCSERSTVVSPVHESQISVTGMSNHTGATAASHLRTQTACHSGMGSFSCGMPCTPVPSHHISLAITSSLPTYRSVNRVLIVQFVPEPPQRPPQAL
jgi:hypothetical protein